MTLTLAHRGPDDEGYYFSDSLGLGFRRLSIIDLEGGHQPMADPEQTVWVVFNGEIYNFVELRGELEKYGHRFRTNSDTEVIVHGYKQWGEDLLNHLNGMFGLAIWDELRKQLMLARDRMGIKLLYYKLETDRLLFGSEIRPILTFEGKKPELDPAAMNLFLRYRYTPSPLTIFKGIKKLAPGTRLILQENREPRLERWWNFMPVPFDPMPSVTEAEERLAELYERAVKRQLMSDVPLGLLLSGGVDSALLLALMQKNGNLWNTYTVGYGHAFADDELSDAAHTARNFKAPNIRIEINQSLFEETLPKIISALEEPVATSSIVPMYHLCERARQDVKVALIGQGPDELFGGYTRHLGIHYGRFWRSLPKWFRRISGSVLSAFPRNEAIKRALYSLDVPNRVKRYQQVFSILPDKCVNNLFRDGLLARGTGDRMLECWQDLEPLMEHTDELGGLQFLEIRCSLPDELLMYADKMSMAHSLEVRVPYLDHELVEYVECLGASFKIQFGVRKWLHKRVASRFLPREILHRKKRGFAANVVDDWFRSSLSNRMESILLDENSLIFQYLHPRAVQKLLSDHQAQHSDNHKILFSLVLLEEFLRITYCSTPVPSVESRFFAETLGEDPISGGAAPWGAKGFGRGQ